VQSSCARTTAAGPGTSACLDGFKPPGDPRSRHPRPAARLRPPAWGELVALEVEHIQQGLGRWVLPDFRKSGPHGSGAGLGQGAAGRVAQCRRHPGRAPVLRPVSKADVVADKP
jgi:hypothetical protein